MKAIKLLLFLGVLFLLFSCSEKEILNQEEKQWLHKNDSLTIALYPYYAPYQYINDNGNVEGVFIDYLHLLEEKIDYKFTQKQYDYWPNVLTDVKKGNVDIILEAQPTQQRKQDLTFYQLFFESDFVIVTRKDHSSGSKIADYEGKTLTLPKGFAINQILQNDGHTFNIVPNPDDFTCLQKLNEGQYDAYVGPKAIVNYYIKTQGLNDIFIVGSVAHSYEPAIAVNKSDGMLNSIIAKANANITYKEKRTLLDNWLFTVVKPFYLKIWFWLEVLGIVLIVLLFIFGFNRYLGMKVEQRTKELKIAKKQAEESNRIKKNLINNISHETRTPMNGIIGYSELLKNEKLPFKTREAYANALINCGKQLVAVMNDMLEISNLSKNTQVNKPVETDLESLFKKTNSFFSLTAQRKGIDLILNSSIIKEQNLVLLDKDKFSVILISLIDNAIKFTKKGKVTVAYRIENERLITTIQDTGIGIGSEKKELLFENFSQLEEDISKKHDGLGLGLVIAKENAKAIQGTVSFTSRLKKGSVFTIEAPCNSIHQKEQEPTDTASSEPIDENEYEKKHHVLIAEDGEINFRILSKYLEEMNGLDFNIHHAKDGKEAVDFFKEGKKAAIVLMDIKMPRMDGYEATSLIKKSNPNVQVIVQTAYSSSDDIQQAYDSGCDAFISKPIDKEYLEQLVHTSLINSQKKA